MKQISHLRSMGVVKDGKYTKSSNLSLEGEASELERCSRLHVQTPHVKPIELIQYDSHKNLLVTKYVKGDSLFNILWNHTSLLNSIMGSSVKNNLLLLRIEELGSWLASYHDSWKSKGDYTIASQWLTESFQRKMGKLYARGGVSREMLKNLEEFSATIPQRLKVDSHSRLCKIHGDFIGYNMIFAQNHNVHILDFGDTRVGFNLEDVVRFWEHMWAIGQSYRWKATFFSMACEAFLTGYGFNKSMVNHESFHVLRLYNAVNNLLTFHFAKTKLSWGSRNISKQITNASITWAKQAILSSR